MLLLLRPLLEPIDNYVTSNTTTTGSNKRRPQIQWLPAHVPYVAPHLAAKPRRRTRKARETDLLFLGR